MITMKQSALTRLAAGIGSAVVALGLSAIPAGAEQTEDVSTVKKATACKQLGNAAMACFRPYGDVLEVWDDAADGWRVSAEWKTDYGRSGVCAIKTGKDHRKCNYDMAEGHQITFRVVKHQVNGNRIELSGWRRATI